MLVTVVLFAGLVLVCFTVFTFLVAVIVASTTKSLISLLPLNDSTTSCLQHSGLVDFIEIRTYSIPNNQIVFFCISHDRIPLGDNQPKISVDFIDCVSSH